MIYCSTSAQFSKCQINYKSQYVIDTFVFSQNLYWYLKNTIATSPGVIPGKALSYNIQGVYMGTTNWSTFTLSLTLLCLLRQLHCGSYQRVCHKSYTVRSENMDYFVASWNLTQASIKVAMISSSRARLLPASEQQRWRNGRKAVGKPGGNARSWKAGMDESREEVE